jgi:hypothetical protein
MVFYNLLKKLVAGLGSLIPAATKLSLNNVAYTGASLVAAFTNYVTLYESVASSKNQYQVAVKQLQAATPGARSLFKALSSYLRGQFGTGNPQLAQLGIKTGARKPASPTVKVAASTQGLATKKARGIIGKKQRSAIPAAGKVTVQLLGPDGNPIQSSGSAVPPAQSGGGNGSTGVTTPSGK